MLAEGYGKVLGRPGLALEVRELCIVAILAGQDAAPQLYAHLRGALNVGAYGRRGRSEALEPGLPGIAAAERAGRGDERGLGRGFGTARARRRGRRRRSRRRMFVDYAVINVYAGTGGSGAEAFRREAGVPRGGPAGGNGGKGRRRHPARRQPAHDASRLPIPAALPRGARPARDGEEPDGPGRRGPGAAGPAGTVVKDADTGEVLGELVEDGERAGRRARRPGRARERGVRDVDAPRADALGAGRGRARSGGSRWS